MDDESGCSKLEHAEVGRSDDDFGVQIADAALHAAEIGAVDVSVFSELVLGETPFTSAGSICFAELAEL